MTPSSARAARDSAEPQPAVSVGARRDLGPRLQRGDDQGRPLRPGRRLPDGRRRRAGPRRRASAASPRRSARPAANLLEAEVVTADGEVRIANACTNPDLFWALKGGGGGFGVVTRVTLRTHALPEYLRRRVRDRSRRRPTTPTAASSPRSSNSTPRRFSIRIGANRSLRIGRRLRRDLDGLPGPRPATGGGGMETVLRLGRRFAAGFRHRVGAAGSSPLPAQPFWDPAVLSRFPGVVISDDRPGAPADKSSGPATSTRRARSGTPINPPGCRPRSSKPTGAKASPTRCSRRRSTGRGAAFQQGARGRAGGGDRGGEGYGDEPGGHRRFRAGDQRRLGTARLSRRSRT